MESENRKRIVASWISLLVSVLLLVLKTYAFRRTGSHAILSDALESIVNVAAACLALFVIYMTARPADSEHPYGYGKLEFFSAAFEGGLIFFAGSLIVYEGFDAFWKGVSLRELDLGLALVVIAGLINFALGFFLIGTGKTHHSAALVASGKHVISDSITSVGVLVGLVLVKITGQLWIDPAVAIFVGVHLAYSGLSVFRSSAGELIDRKDSEIIEMIGKLFHRNIFPGIIRFHHTRVIRSGRYHHIDAHVVVPEFWNVMTAHTETEKFEQNVIRDYRTEGEIHFHLDPCRRVYCKVCDYPDCPVRNTPFEKRVPFTLEELTSPTEER